jgi:hypothetical protein
VVAIRATTEAALETARRDGVTSRRAAVALATARVRHAMSLRRWSVF